MSFELPHPKAAYIGLSLELYLTASAAYLDNWRRAFDTWSGELAGMADISVKKLCFTDDDVREAEKLIREAEPEVIVLSAVSYTPSMLIVPLLKKLDIPVVIWSTQDAAVIKEDYAPEDLSNNHTVQGIQDITNVLFQSGINYSIVTGHCSDSRTMEKLAVCLRAARAANAAKNIRVLALGGAFSGMGDFDYDPENLRQMWGPEAVGIDADEFLGAVADVDADIPEGLRQKDLEAFDVDPALDPAIHRESIRRKVAVENLLNKYRANAFTMNFTNLRSPSFGQLPFYAINVLMAQGIGYAGEGDVLRAAAMRQLVELVGEGNFSEIYTVDFKRDLFFMSHMQECSIGIARKDRKVRLKQMPFWVQGMSDYTGMFFTAEPGDYTLVCITPEPGGRFRMVSFTGNVPDLPVLETYNRAYWLLRPAKPAGEMLDLYSLAGGAHHLSAIPGKRTGELAMLAKMLGFTFVDLDR